MYLPKIGDHKSREHEAEGGQLDGLPAEMAHVSKQRLSTCNHPETQRMPSPGHHADELDLLFCVKYPVTSYSTVIIAHQETL